MSNAKLDLYAKTEPCTNRQHGKAPDHVRDNCRYWHDQEEDRWLVVNGRRMRWSMALQNQLARDEEAQRAAEAATSRATWIAHIKQRPNYKTAECHDPNRENPELHDHETCAFSHGYDFNAEGAALLAASRPPPRARQPAADRHAHASERRQAQAFNATRAENVEYDAAFPNLN